MNFDTLISSNAVISNHKIKSKKRALELLAETLAEEAMRAQQTDNQDDEKINALDIFQLLIEREKLGSTSLGHGVALPHARTALTKNAVGVFLKLEQGIDFDSPDSQATDLIFALLVPEHYTDEHLKILSYLATLFSDEEFCKSIRDATNSSEIYNHLIHWQLTSQAS
ncbi:MAG: PTS sugar transporter subunit IIA [Gammaproteobacteria bacterium]|nr:PTS sugar transporter subunit IIA [Gammaproteobacteria bacterium]